MNIESSAQLLVIPHDLLPRCLVDVVLKLATVQHFQYAAGLLEEFCELLAHGGGWKTRSCSRHSSVAKLSRMSMMQCGCFCLMLR